MYWALYIMACIVCGRGLGNGFSYFCRGCYREVHKQLPITTTDLKRYLEISLGTRIKIGNGWNFKMIHKTLQQTQPTLDKLAVLLEKLLFLKFANCKDLDLKASRAKPFNDRVCCPRCGWYSCEPNQ